MYTEELDKSFEPTQYVILGYVYDMWESSDETDVYHASISPFSIRSNNKWISLFNLQGKNIHRFLEEPIFAYKITKSFPMLTKETFLEFHVRESTPNKGLKYTIDYEYEVKIVSLPLVLETDYSNFIDQITNSFFNPDSVILQVENELNGKYYLQNNGAKDSLILGPFKVLKTEGGYKMLPFVGKEIFATTLPKSAFADYNITLPNGYKRLLNENDFNSLKKETIDCMTAKQLADWGRNLIKDFESIDEKTISNVLNLLKADASNDYMAKIRLKRIIKEFDWISEIVRTFEKQKNNLVDLYIDQHPELKKEIENRRKNDIIDLEKVLKSFSSQIDAAKTELDLQKKEKNKMEEEYNSIESKFKEKRSNLETDLTRLKNEHEKLNTEIIKLKDTRNLLKIQIEDKTEVKYFVIDDSSRKSFSELCEESDIEISLGHELKRNAKRLGFEGDFCYSLGEDYPFLNCQAMFVPNISWAYAYGAVLGKTKIAAIYPEYDWLHYRDFKEAGLEKILIDASLEDTYTFIIYIDGFNIVTPESGLRSLLDVITGQALTLANTGRGMPKNLKILASLLPSLSDNPDERIGLHLRPEKFVKWGAISAPDNQTIYNISDDNISNLISFDSKDIMISRVEADDSLWIENKEKYFAY